MSSYEHEHDDEHDQEVFLLHCERRARWLRRAIENSGILFTYKLRILPDSEYIYSFSIQYPKGFAFAKVSCYIAPGFQENYDGLPNTILVNLAGADNEMVFIDELGYGGLELRLFYSNEDLIAELVRLATPNTGAVAV